MSPPGEGRNDTTRVHAEVRDGILLGQLPPGQTFSQVQLAAQLGVSRTPLREALRLLQTEGLVQSQERRRVRVASLELADLDELYAMRVALEPLAVRATVPLLGPRELAALRDDLEVYADAVAARRLDEVREPHRRFHLGLVQHAGARLRRAVGEAWDHAERYRLLYTRSGDDRFALHAVAEREHAAILAAAEQHDAETCGDLVTQHLARTALTVMATQDSRHAPTLLRDALDHAARPGAGGRG